MKKKPVDVFVKATFGSAGAVTLTDNGLATRSLTLVNTGNYLLELDDAGPYADLLCVSKAWSQPAIPAVAEVSVATDGTSKLGFGVALLSSVIATNTLVVAGVTFTAIAGATSGQSFHVGVSDTLTAVELANSINNSASAFAGGVVVTATAYGPTVSVFANQRYFWSSTGGTFTLLPTYASGQLGQPGMLLALTAAGTLTAPNSGDKLLLDLCFNSTSVK